MFKNYFFNYFIFFLLHIFTYEPKLYKRKKMRLSYDIPYYFSSYHLLPKNIQLMLSAFNYYPQAAGRPRAVPICRSLD